MNLNALKFWKKEEFVLDQRGLTVVQRLENGINGLRKIWEEQYKGQIWLNEYTVKELGLKKTFGKFVMKYAVKINEKKEYEKFWENLIDICSKAIKTAKEGKYEKSIENTEKAVKKFKLNIRKLAEKEKDSEKDWKEYLVRPLVSETDSQRSVATPFKTFRDRMIREILGAKFNRLGFEALSEKFQEIAQILEGKYEYRAELRRKIEQQYNSVNDVVKELLF